MVGSSIFIKTFKEKKTTTRTVDMLKRLKKYLNIRTHSHLHTYIHTKSIHTHIHTHTIPHYITKLHLSLNNL